MNLIDADAIIAALESFADLRNGNTHFLNGIETAKEIVTRLPEAVVRCKDCRYLKTGENERESWSICARVIVYPYLDVGPNDYCSYAEWREA